MTQQRVIPDAARVTVESTGAPDAILAFMTISHPALVAPIRVVCDVLDYTMGGDLYQGVLFDWKALTDTDGAPVTELTIENVSREIGEALDVLNDRAGVDLVVCSSADFDLTKDPREEIGTAAQVYAIRRFQIVDVSLDAIEARARVMIEDPSVMPWPAVVATQRRCPGLFR